MRIAEVGNVVEWEHASIGEKLKGKVFKVLENTALVDLTINPNWKALGLNERTVVKHKSYQIIDDAVEDIENAYETTTYKIEPGSVENYQLLRNAGFVDTKIRELWNEADKELNWHNARFYTWKQEQGLVNSHKKPQAEKPVEVEKTIEEPKKEEAILAPVEVEELLTEEVPSTQIDVLQEIIPEHPIFTGELEREEPAPTIKYDPVGPVSAVDLVHLKATIEKLTNELESTKQALWSERTARLFEMQANLDALICESNGLQIADFSSEHVLATIVELAEVAQEEQSFKYWKKNKQIDRKKLIEELADVLHFILSRGVQNGIKRISSTDTLLELKYDSPTEQILYIIETLLAYRQANMPKEYYTQLFKAFIDFTELLGFTWEELSDAYVQKNNVNIARQNQNY